MQECRVNRSVCREFPLLHSSPNPHDHAPLARHRSHRTATIAWLLPQPSLPLLPPQPPPAAAPPTSNSLRTKGERERPSGAAGASSASARPPVAVAASLPLFSLPEGKVIRSAGCVSSHCATHATSPPGTSCPSHSCCCCCCRSGGGAGPTSNRGNAFRLASFYCRRRTPQQQQQIRRPQDR